MSENSGCGTWGCGCVTVLLVLFVGIPLLLGVFGVAKSEFNQYREERRQAKADAEEAKRTAEEQARIEAMRAQERQARKEAEAKAATEKAKVAAQKAKATADREDRLRTFALREAPELWRSYQELGSQIEVQRKRTESLRETLTEFGRDAEQDADFKAICAMRNEMIEVRASLRRKIEDAYFAFRKFEATPSRKEYDELRRKTLEDGIREAQSAVQRFNTMRKEK